MNLYFFDGGLAFFLSVKGQSWGVAYTRGVANTSEYGTHVCTAQRTCASGSTVAEYHAIDWATTERDDQLASRKMKHVSMLLLQEISVEFCFDTGKI